MPLTPKLFRSLPAQLPSLRRRAPHEPASAARIHPPPRSGRLVACNSTTTGCQSRGGDRALSFLVALAVVARCGACGPGTRKIYRAQPQRKHRPGKAHHFDFDFSMMACTAIGRSAAPYWAASGAANGGCNCFHLPDSKLSHAHRSLSSADTDPAAPAERTLWPLAHILFSLNRVSFSKANGSSVGGRERTRCSDMRNGSNRTGTWPHLTKSIRSTESLLPTTPRPNSRNSSKWILRSIWTSCLRWMPLIPTESFRYL